MDEDYHHCNCFVISPRYFEYLRRFLLDNGFFVPLQENHGQLFGLAKNLDETLQFHIKIMRNGRIEAEAEPRTKYLEHLNQEYSSPAHYLVKQVLDASRIPYRQISNSSACLSGEIKYPNKTTSVVGAIFVVLAVVVLALAKK